MRRAPGAMVTDKVRLVAPLGVGGMGEVWEAEHVSLGNRVAVKFIREELSEHKEELIRRLEREAKVVAKLRSPHAVRIFDHGLIGDDGAYIIMELLEGQSLAQRLKRHGTLDLTQVAQLVSQVATVLAEAHEHGVVHRDIKPDNIYLVRSEQLFVKVLDFGIAKVQSLPQATAATATNVMMGTPHYMSPEQVVSAKRVDAGADLWALAVVAYESLTGVVPFDGETLGAVVLAINSAKFVRPSRVSSESVPEAVDRWFRRALYPKREKRFSDAREMAEAFEIATEISQAPVAAERLHTERTKRSARASWRAPNKERARRRSDAPRADGARGDGVGRGEEARRGKSTLVMASPKPGQERGDDAQLAYEPTQRAKTPQPLPELQLDLPKRGSSERDRKRSSKHKRSSSKRSRSSSSSGDAERRRRSSEAPRGSSSSGDRAHRSSEAPRGSSSSGDRARRSSEAPGRERRAGDSVAPRPALTLSTPPRARAAGDTPRALAGGEQLRIKRIYREVVTAAVIAAVAIAAGYGLGPSPRASLVASLGASALYAIPLCALLAFAAGAKVWDRAQGGWPLRIAGVGLLALGLCLAIASADVLSPAFEALSEPELPAAAALSAAVVAAGFAAHGVLGALEELLRKPPQMTVALLLLTLSVAGLAASYQLVRGPVVELLAAPAAPAPSVDAGPGAG